MSQVTSPGPTSKPSRFKRKLLINRRLQLTLIVYSAGLASVVALMVLIFQTAITSGWINQIYPLAVVSVSAVISLGSVLYLALVLTNRIAGPLFRLEQELKRIADGGPARVISVRKYDEFEELILQYNRVMTTLQPVATNEETNEKN